MWFRNILIGSHIPRRSDDRIAYFYTDNILPSPPYYFYLSSHTADLVDLAGILGLHSMLNQDQFHASILNKGQKSGDKFESVVKASMPKRFPMLPDNMTDPEQSANAVCRNEPDLTELNLNNVRLIPRETFKKLFNGLKTNTHLKSLTLTNTGLTDGPAEVIWRFFRFLTFLPNFHKNA